MGKKDTQLMIPDEVIMSKIYLIRGKKVMLDRDLAELYELVNNFKFCPSSLIDYGYYGVG